MEQTTIAGPALARIAALLLLFLLVPFLPPSLRAPYLYLLFNVLVLVLAVQAGFLSPAGLRGENKSSSSSSSSSSSTGTSSSPNLQTKLVNQAVMMTTNADHHHIVSGATTFASPPLPIKQEIIQLREVKVKLLAIKDVVGVGRKLKEKIRRCPSRASIFFLGSVDPDDNGEVVDATLSSSTVHEGHDEAEKAQRKWKVDHASSSSSSGDHLMSKHELFTKADAFITNFYKQVKMQREESWNKLQDLYSYHHHSKPKKTV